MSSEKFNIPNVSIRQIQMCVAVFRLGSIVNASKKLGITSSAISMGIREAEKQLKCELFHRNKREMRVSESGRLLFPRMEELLRQVEEFDTVLGGENSELRGHLVIGASSTLGCYILPKMISVFQQNHPKVDIDIKVANTSDVLKKVSQFAVDIAFVEGPSFVGDCELDCLWQDELVVFCNPTSRLSTKRRVKWSELGSERWLLREDGSGTHSILANAFAKHHIHPKRAVHVGNTEAVIRCVEKGMGIACLSKYAIRRSLNLGLISLVQVSPVKRCFFHACHAHRHLGILARSFLDELKQMSLEAFENEP